MANWHLLPVVYLFYILALVVNIVAVLSLPYGSAFIAEIQFNEETFSGSVNGKFIKSSCKSCHVLLNHDQLS